MSEAEILNQINILTEQLKSISLTKKNLNAEIAQLDTVYGEYNLQLDLLKENLRRLKLSTVTDDQSEREADIERFRLILPDITKGLE